MNTFSFYKRKPVLKENNSFGKAFLSKKRFVLAELSDKYHREGWKFWEEDLEFILAKTEIIDLTKEIAIKAGETKKMMRNSHPNFGLADAIIYETAQNVNAPVLTGDEHFKDVENVIYIKG
jgi:predicted nucleic acid-binding protein